jgi:thioredoxin 1
MTNAAKLMVGAVIVVAVVAVVVFKQSQTRATQQWERGTSAAASRGALETPGDSTSPVTATETATSPEESIPDTRGSEDSSASSSPAKARFIEVGADRCVPCQMMKPILEELRAKYEDRLEIEFADTWKDPSLGLKYGVQVIPTQIICDENGEEVFRHQGYWPQEEIERKLAELGLLE